MQFINCLAEEFLRLPCCRRSSFAPRPLEVLGAALGPLLGAVGAADSRLGVAAVAQSPEKGYVATLQILNKILDSFRMKVTNF